VLYVLKNFVITDFFKKLVVVNVPIDRKVEGLLGEECPLVDRGIKICLYLEISSIGFFRSDRSFCQVPFDFPNYPTMPNPMSESTIPKQVWSLYDKKRNQNYR